MIISHKYKFLYLNIPKVASTTLHSYFSELGVCELHWDVKKLHEELVQSNINTEDYFKFTFVRNPWDRLVGCWNQKCRPNHTKRKFSPFFSPLEDISFNDFVYAVDTELSKRAFTDEHIKQMTEQLKKYDIFSERDFDFIGRFETLQRDFNIVCNAVGLPSRKLSHKNKSAKKRYRKYTEYYTDETQKKVAELYKSDIEYFGYEFDEARPPKKLVCIYTQLKDAEKLEEFKKSSLYSKMISNPNMKVIEVYAGSPQTKYSDGKLFLSCEEEYSKLSVKTYEMLKYCANNFDFDHLIKIDSTLIDYAHRTDVILDSKILSYFYNVSRLSALLFSDRFSESSDYFGSLLFANGSCRGYDLWAQSKNLKINYYQEFPDDPPVFYTGKFYAMSNRFVKYVVKTGESIAHRHVTNMGGSEDTFIGRMFTRFHGSKWQYQSPWIDDLKESHRIRHETLA